MSVHHKGASLDFTFSVTEQVRPPDATHALKCGFRNFMGYSQQQIKAKVESTIVPVVNGILSPMGWIYRGVGVFGDYFEIYYKASPVEPVTVGTCVTILTLITIIIIGLVIVYCAWVYLETKKMVAQAKVDKKKLLEEGKITNDQYTELIKSQEEEDMFEMFKWGIILIIILAIIGMIPRGRRD